MSDLLLGTIQAHYTAIRDKLKKWLGSRESGELITPWVPLDNVELGWLSEYQRSVQQKTKTEIARVTIELEVKNLTTGRTELQALRLNHPLVCDISQHVNWPERGAQSDCCLLTFFGVARRER